MQFPHRRLILLFPIVLVSAAPVAAVADVEVQVGYADNLRPSPFFPIPWQGGTNVALFAGSGPNYDAGAIRVINNGATAITINGLTVNSFGDGASFSLWGSYIGTGFVLNPGMSAIFTQTAEYNFDSSDDEGGHPLAIPEVHLTINGTTGVYDDTAQVLNTEGTDHLGASNLNESHQWRDINTFGGQAAPEPSSMALAGLGGLVLLARRRFRARKQVA